MKKIIACGLILVLVANLCSCCLNIPFEMKKPDNSENRPAADESKPSAGHNETLPVEETVAPMPEEETAAPMPEEGDRDVIQVLDELLLGLNVQSGPVSNWTNEDVYHFIYCKLLMDGYGNSNSRLTQMGLTCSNNGEDYYDHYDLEKVEKLTLDTLGRSLPASGGIDWAYISGDEFVLMPAAGEATEYRVQNYKVRGDEIVAVGAIIFYGGYNMFCGYFEAVVKPNPSSIYGYTLVSVKEIYDNQNLKNLTANASSVLENSQSYSAANAVDGDEKTAWVEGVSGDGIGQWLKIETADGSKVELSVIELHLGYHKSDSLWDQNGKPTRVLLEFEDGTQQQADVYYIDVIVLDEPIKTSWVKITILDAVPGTVYSDTCISEVSLFGLAT